MPMVPVGTQSYPKFQHFASFGKELEIETVCFENPKLNPNNNYS